jgi:hypothetical protein
MFFLQILPFQGMRNNSSPERYTQKMNHNKVLLHKPKLLRSKLSGACQVYCCYKLACDVTDFEAYRSLPRLLARD